MPKKNQRRNKSHQTSDNGKNNKLDGGQAQGHSSAAAGGKMSPLRNKARAKPTEEAEHEPEEAEHEPEEDDNEAKEAEREPEEDDEPETGDGHDGAVQDSLQQLARGAVVQHDLAESAPEPASAGDVPRPVETKQAPRPARPHDEDKDETHGEVKDDEVKDDLSPEDAVFQVLQSRVADLEETMRILHTHGMSAHENLGSFPRLVDQARRDLARLTRERKEGHARQDHYEFVDRSIFQPEYLAQHHDARRVIRAARALESRAEQQRAPKVQKPPPKVSAGVDALFNSLDGRLADDLIKQVTKFHNPGDVICYVDKNPIASAPDTYDFAMTKCEHNGGDCEHSVSKNDAEVGLLSPALDAALKSVNKKVEVILCGPYGACDGCKQRIDKLLTLWQQKAPAGQTLVVHYVYAKAIGQTRGSARIPTNYGDTSDSYGKAQGKSANATVYVHTWPQARGGSKKPSTGNKPSKDGQSKPKDDQSKK